MRAAAVLLVLLGGIAAGQEIRLRSEFQGPGDAAIARPREILSPAVARNAFASFYLTITVPAGEEYALEIGQNPEDAVKATLSDASGKTVGYPLEGKAERDLEATYLLDLWVDREAPVRRIKVEPQLRVGQHWISYPMEVRVVKAIVPAIEGASWGKLLCGAAREESRNVRQDAALAKHLGPEITSAAIREAGYEPAALCTQPPSEWYLRVRDILYRKAIN